LFLNDRPATKLLPILELSDLELPQSALILTLDDDRWYKDETLETLVATAKRHPHAVVATGGRDISDEDHFLESSSGTPHLRSSITAEQRGVPGSKFGRTDIIVGANGVLYRKHFFSNASELWDFGTHTAFSRHCAFVDDVWISGHLERLKIPRIIPGISMGSLEENALGKIAPLWIHGGDQHMTGREMHNRKCAEAFQDVHGIWKGQGDCTQGHGQCHVAVSPEPA